MFKYKYCVASVVSNNDGSGNYHATFYAYEDGYGLHTVDNIKDDCIIWYDTEKEALKHRLNDNDCIISIYAE